jgi:glucokinase
MEAVLCIDLGGTKSAASLVTRSGEIIYRTAELTPSHASGNDLANFLISLGNKVIQNTDASPIGIGVSVGGPADARRGEAWAAPALPGWGQGYPLAATLSAAFRGTTVRIENDADATALAEHRFGAGQGTHTMAFLTVGTGIGSGLIVENRLLRGKSGAGGEIGHVAVDHPGRPCVCGMTGCLEAYACGPSIVKIAQELGSAATDGPSAVALARAGEAAAKQAFDQAGEMLGRGLATLSMLIEPQRFVLGTLAVHAPDLLIPPARASHARHAWSRNASNVDIVPAGLGDRAQDLAALCAFLARESE